MDILELKKSYWKEVIPAALKKLEILGKNWV